MEVTLGVVITAPVDCGSSSSSCLLSATEAGVTGILLYDLSGGFSVTHKMEAISAALWMFVLVEITGSVDGGEFALSFIRPDAT